MEPASPAVSLHLGDCLDVMRTLPDSSVSLIVADPPYYRVKAEAWDRQWDTPAGFLAWVGDLCREWHRVLKPNGSLYCFASPRMAARVECKVAETFEVLNHVVWNKVADYEPGDPRATAYRARDQASFRRYFDYSERVIFAEHFGADSHAKGESGYGAKCDELRGFVFEPLRAYLDGERTRAGVDFERVRAIVGCAPGSGLPSHWFTRSQWMLPTAANYRKLRDGFNATGGDYLRREYDDLRREYDDLRREYDGLRRPFTVSADVPYTDVWDFPTVAARPGKHSCQKPEPLIAHMLRASSRPGDVVLDPFMGSGITGVVAAQLGLSFVGIEQDPKWFHDARRRVLGPVAAPAPPPPGPSDDGAPDDLPLFARACQPGGS